MGIITSERDVVEFVGSLFGKAYDGEVYEVDLVEGGRIKLLAYVSAGDVMVRLDDRDTGDLSTSWLSMRSDDDVYEFCDDHVLHLI